MVGAAVKTPAPPMQPAAKPKVNPPQREPGSAPKRPGMPAPIVRVVISVVIVWHFAGIFFAALSINNTSDLVADLSQKPPMQWYLDALYLNQGHSFFAPEVGPGHVIRYQLFDQKGSVVEQGELPSRKEHWPRLFYHRHFMLADQSEYPTDNKQVRDYWQKRFLDAFGDHLLRVNPNAQSVRLQRIAHWPLPSYYIDGALDNIKKEIDQLDKQGRTADGDELSSHMVQEAMIRGYTGFANDFSREAQGRHIDAQGYELIGETTRSRRDLVPEPNAQTSNWQGNRPNPNGQMNRPSNNLQYNQQYSQQYNQPNNQQYNGQYNQMNTATRVGGPTR